MKFKVYSKMSAHIYLGEFEAETEEEAEEMAWNSDYDNSLCHACARRIDISDLETIKLTTEGN